MKRLLIFLSVLIYWSCVPDQKNKIKSADTFYDIQGLIDEQLRLLDSISPSILKMATIDGNEEITELNQLDSTDWAKELIVLRSTDINKSNLRDSYEVTESGDIGNVTISHISRYPDRTPVENLTIHLDKGDQKPIKIYAVIDDSNELFSSSKILEMHFFNKNAKQLLSGYRIKGSQKMISKDSTCYFIEVEISYP